MNKTPALILLYLIIFPVIHTQDQQYEEKDVFVATKEWKTVRKGQKIPKGLHVRINFQTGVTEAKLLDENEQDDKMNAITVPKDFDSLGKIRSKKDKKPNFKTYEQIKEDLSELNLVTKTDAEILKGLLGDFNEHQTDGKILPILKDLEYLAHQYDNALEFVRLNGFKEVIYKSLNTSSADVKVHTLILMGSLAQNNPKVQIHAVDTGSLSLLQRGLLDKSFEVKYKSVFALGSILRRFPWAQLKFIEGGGLVSLLDALDSSDIKLRLRIVTLLYDLMMEYEFVIKDESNDSEKLLQYKSVDLKNKLLSLDYCKSLNKLFMDLITMDGKDIDSISKCVTAMSALAEDCKPSYPDDLLSILSKFKTELSSSDDEVVIGVTDSISQILSNARLKVEL